MGITKATITQMKEAECFKVGFGTLVPVPEVKSCAVDIEWVEREADFE